MKTEDKWQAEREHFAKGGRVQWRRPSIPNRREWSEMRDGHAHVEIGCPKFALDCEYRIHPDDKPVEAPAAQEKTEGDDWTCKCGWFNYGLRSKCRYCHLPRPDQVEKCPTCGCPKGKILLGICKDPWHPSEDNPQPPQDKCPHCDFVGDICPQHNRMGRVPIEVKRAIEEDQKAEKPPQEKWEPRFMVGDWVLTKDQPSPEWKRRVRTIDTLDKLYRLESRDGILLFGAWREEDLSPAPSTDNPSRILTPEELTKLCGNQPPHRTDGWNTEWLPEGTRPLLKGEVPVVGVDELFIGISAITASWVKVTEHSSRIPHHRTRRPLPPTQPATAKTAGEAARRADTATMGDDPAHYWNTMSPERKATWERIAQAAIAFASSAETQGVPSVWKLCQIYNNTAGDGYATHEERISAVREACMRAKVTEDRVAILRALNAAGAPTTDIGDGSELSTSQRIEWLHTEKGLADARLVAIQRVWKERAESAEAKVKQLGEEADRIAKHVGAPTLAEAFDVLIRTKAQDEDVIAQQFATIKRQASEVQTADALRREVAAIKTKSEERKAKLVKIFDILLGDEPTEESVSLLKKGDGDA